MGNIGAVVLAGFFSPLNRFVCRDSVVNGTREDFRRNCCNPSNCPPQELKKIGNVKPGSRTFFSHC